MSGPGGLAPLNPGERLAGIRTALESRWDCPVGGAGQESRPGRARAFGSVNPVVLGLRLGSAPSILPKAPASGSAKHARSRLDPR